MAQRLTEKDHLRAYIKQLLEHSKMLGELVDVIEQFNSTRLLSGEEFSALWATVDEANNLIAGPTRAYVDQG